MAFWGAATEGLKTGIPLGVRAMERKEDKEFKEKAYGLQVEASERAEAREEREAADWEEKQQFKKSKTSFLQGWNRLMNSGDELGAASIWTDTYNKFVPDGNQAMIILPQRNPEYFQQLVQSGQVDPNLANSPVLLMSKNHGILPYDSMQTLGMDIASDLQMENWTAMRKQRQEALAVKNAESMKSPVQDEGGKWWVQNWTENKDGTFAVDWKPYEGPAPAGEVRKKIFAMGLDPDSDKGKKISLILGGAEGAPPSEFERGLETEASKRVGEAATEAIETSKQARGLSTSEEKRKGEKHDLEIEKLKKEIEGKTLNAKDVADLRIKLVKLWQDENLDPLGEIKEGAESLEDYLKKYMPIITGKTEASAGGGGTGKPKVFRNKKTGEYKEVYPDGRTLYYDKDGNEIGKNKVRHAITK